MKAILVQSGCHEALEGASKKPWGMSDNQWEEIDLKALSTIHLCLSNEVLREVAKETTCGFVIEVGVILHDKERDRPSITQI